MVSGDFYYTKYRIKMHYIVIVRFSRALFNYEAFTMSGVSKTFTYKSLQLSIGYTTCFYYLCNLKLKTYFPIFL